jgi:hypothetical protein
MIDSSFYSKIHEYLLSQGQQELAGHLDTIWQELSQARQALSSQPEASSEQASNNEVQAIIDREKSGWGSGSTKVKN